MSVQTGCVIIINYTVIFASTLNSFVSKNAPVNGKRKFCLREHLKIIKYILQEICKNIYTVEGVQYLKLKSAIGKTVNTEHY